MSHRFLAGAMLALGMACAQAQSFSFGLWGDMPYQKAGDDPKIPALLKSINQSDIAFSIYDGDIKDGSSKCTEDIYASALAMLKTAANPGGLPIEVFDGIRQGELANRSQLYLDIASGPFFGFNRPGAKVSQGLIQSFWVQGMAEGPGAVDEADEEPQS